MNSLFQLDLFYPYAIPPLLTFFVCFFLATLTIQAGKTKRENKFFTIYCLLQALLNLDITFITLCKSKAVALSISRFDHMFWVFITPVAIQFIHEVAGIRNRKKLVWSLYLFSLIIAFLTHTEYYFYDTKKYFFGFFHQGGPVFQIFGGVSLCAIIYAAYILWTMFKRSAEPRQKLKAQFILYGFLANAILTFGNIFPILGIEFYPLGNFGFIPMLLMAYGLFQHDLFEITKEKLSRDFIPKLLILFVWLPLIACIILWLTAGDTFFYHNLSDRITPYAIPSILSFLICFIIATICFVQTPRQTETVLFGLICTLWGFLNLDITMNMLLTDKSIALQVSRTSHLFLVNQLGIIVHFIYSVINRKQRWTFVYPCYLIGFLLMPFTQTHFYLQGSYQYYWGFFAKKNIGFDFFSIAATIATIWGISLLYRANQSETNASVKTKYRYVLVGVIITAILNFFDIPALNGFEIYPFGNFTFIPILIIAYGIFRHDILQINQYTKRRILDIIVKVTVVVGYTALIPICYWAIGDFSWHFISSRIVPYGIPPLLTFICSFFLSILSLRVGRAQKESLIFALMCLFWSFLNIDILLNGIIVNPAIGLQLNRWDHLFFVFVIPLSVHLTYLVVQHKKNWWVVFNCYFISLLISIFTQTKYYFYDMYRYYWGFFAKGGIAFDIFGAYCLLATIYCIYLLVQAYIRESNPFQKHRILYLAFGFIGYAVLTLGDIPAIKGIELYPPGNFSFILLLLFAYGLFKQNLKETMRITRSIIFWIGLIVILFAMAVTLKPIFPTGRPVSLYFTAIVSVLLFYKFIFYLWDNMLSLFFGHEKGRLDEILVSLINDLSKGHNRIQIQRIVKNCILAELSSSHLAMLFTIFPESSDNTPAHINLLGLAGRKYLNPKKNLFSPNDPSGARDNDINIAPNHPLISMFEDHRSLATRDQIEEWMMGHHIFLDASDKLLQSVLILPVYFEQNLTCLILIGNKIDGTVYSTDEKEFFHRFGLALGPCLENANLLEKFEKKVEVRTSELQNALVKTRIKEQEIAHINQVVQTVNSTLDFGEVVAAVEDALNEIFQFDQVSIQLFDKELNILKVAKISGSGIPIEKIQQLESLIIEVKENHSIFADAVLRKKPVYLPKMTSDILEYIWPFDKKLHDLTQGKAYLINPLFVQNNVIGTISFGNTKDYFDLTDEDREKIQRYVSQIATAVNNARLVDETQKAFLETKNKEQEIAHINQVIQTVNSTLDLDEVTAAVGKALREVFQFDQMSIQLIDEETRELVFIKTYGDGASREQMERVKNNRISLEERHSVFISPIIRKKPLYLPEISPELEPLMVKCDREIYRIFLAKAYLFVPLEVQNNIIGVMSFGNTKTFFDLNKKDIEKIQSFVTQIATAIHNAQLANELKQANSNLKTEIKERQKITEALSESEEKYRNILDNMDDIYSELDLAGNIVFFNKAHSEMVGLTPEELMKKNYTEFLDKSTAQKIFNEFHEIFLTGESKLVSWEAILNKGRKIYVEARVSLQKDPDGHPIGFRYLARDITLKRNAEIELKKAKEAAEAATKSKSEFLANMSHEIRTPMNAILGMADLLSETGLTADQKTFVQTIDSSGALLLSIINNILDFSKIEAGQMMIEETNFDLRDLVETTGKMLAVKAHEKELELNCRVAMNVHPFRIGDPTRLRQIFINLLNNAIKFTHHGEVILEVINSNNSEMLQFSIRDTGIGIPKKKQKLIFESFSQVDTSITRKYGGTGLGLAICKRLVEIMGGQIWIESEEGKGTRFLFTVRLPKAESVITPIIASPDKLNGIKTLVVDDCDTNRLICRELLSSWGAAVYESESGVQAIQAITDADRQKNPFHLILLDLRMPEMDGFEVVERINCMSLTISPKIVMLTSSDGMDEKIRARELTIAAYIAKPFRRMELLEGILTSLGKKDKVGVSSKTFQKPNKPLIPPLRILLAEDIEPNRKLIKLYLKNSPITLDTAENGRIAVEKFIGHTYDIVLMDIEMPEMDGFSATRTIRKWEKETNHSKTPVVALTAHAFVEHQKKCIDAGCNGYLTKPIKKNVLIEKILQFTAAEPAINHSVDVADVETNNSSAYSADKCIVKIDAAIKELIPDFMSQTTSDLDIIEKALSKRDSETLRRVGHSLKGSAYMYEFIRLGDMGKTIEESAKIHDFKKIEATLETLKQYLDNIQVET